VSIFGAVRHAKKGRRLEYIQSSAFDASMNCLLAAITAVPVGVVGGCIVALVAIHVFGVDFESPRKYQIIVVSYGITYIYFCWSFNTKGC
jgi:hypothetical protein